MNYTDKKYYEACEEIYSLMFKYTIHILRFEPPIKKIRSGEEQFIKYSKKHIYNYGIKKIIMSSNFLNYVKNKDKVVKEMSENIDEFVKKKYKSVKYVKAYNNDYYHEKRKDKLKEKRMEASKGKPTKAEINKINREKVAKQNLQKVEEALQACKTCNIKPTLAKLMEITELGKNSVVKYKKIILNK